MTFVSNVLDERDCLVVGGGPAGLTAAIYLARFHLDVTVVDDGRSRANWIPCTHNHAGFPDGISGLDLVERMRAQAKKYGVKVEQARVSRLTTIDNRFEAEWGSGIVLARSVLIATGVSNRLPSIDEKLHVDALAGGFLRYCPICDGYEVTDNNVAVIGTGAAAAGEAIFLRSFSDRITMISSDGAHGLEPDDREKLSAHYVTLVDGPCHVTAIEDDQIVIDTYMGAMRFDTAYPALGSDVHSNLAMKLGANLTEKGSIIVDAHQRTSVAGLFAAGDVVLGLDQISHAMGEGSVAATTIRNDLAKEHPILR
jgi:thioredoxin reductase (NADPH)